MKWSEVSCVSLPNAAGSMRPLSKHSREKLTVRALHITGINNQNTFAALRHHLVSSSGLEMSLSSYELSVPQTIGHKSVAHIQAAGG